MQASDSYYTHNDKSSTQQLVLNYNKYDNYEQKLLVYNSIVCSRQGVIWLLQPKGMRGLIIDHQYIDQYLD